MNLDDVKAAHTTDYRTHTFKGVSHKATLRKELEQQMAEFKGKIEIVAAGKTRDLLTFEQLMKGYAHSNMELKNSKKH